MTELRINLSHILDKVGRGQVYAVTRYGKVVAYLVPPDYVKGKRNG